VVSMTRSDLVRMVESLGGKGLRLSPAMRPALEAKLREYFATPEGQEALSRAPRVSHDGSYRPMTADDAVALLLSEVEFREATL